MEFRIVLFYSAPSWMTEVRPVSFTVIWKQKKVIIHLDAISSYFDRKIISICRKGSPNSFHHLNGSYFTKNGFYSGRTLRRLRIYGKMQIRNITIGSQRTGFVESHYPTGLDRFFLGISQN